jgi:hypothetical protein
LRDHHALVLGHGGQDVQRQPGGVRIIDRHELNAGVHHGGDEGHVAGEPVELGHHQLGPLLLTGRERDGKLLAGYRYACRSRSQTYSAASVHFPPLR